MNRGERQPVASHGEILQEKLAPYMLSRVLLLSALFGCIEHSAANFFNLSRASVSPPMRVQPTAGFESCFHYEKNQCTLFLACTLKLGVAQNSDELSSFMSSLLNRSSN